MTIKPIKTEKDYNKALKRLETIFDAKPNTENADELEILSLLIENYESKNFKTDNPDPIEAIKFRMDQLGLNNTDLGNVLGYKSRASEILHRKRKLNLDMIRKFVDKLCIPSDVLIQAY